MILSLFVILVITSVILLYCSNKHQYLLIKPLPTHYKGLSLCCSMAALYVVNLQLSGVAAAMTWLVVTMLCLIILPSTIFFVKVKNER